MIGLWGAVLHFEHIAYEKAISKLKVRDKLFVIETINTPLAHDETDPMEVHFNKYFASTLPSAISLANSFEVSAQVVAEEVIAIRKAKLEEIELYYKALTHF